MATLAFRSVAQAAIQWAQTRLDAVKLRSERDAEIESALERARVGIQDLASLAAELETSLPERVGRAVREGVQTEAAPVGRQLAEVRGLSSVTIRRLEGLAGQLEAERHARLDDLAVLIDLIASSWQGVEQRLERIEERLPATDGNWLRALG